MIGPQILRSKGLKMKQHDEKKADYTKPELTVFGSVRNLTGGSNALMDGDATTMDML